MEHGNREERKKGSKEGEEKGESGRKGKFNIYFLPTPRTRKRTPLVPYSNDLSSFNANR